MKPQSAKIDLPSALVFPAYLNPEAVELWVLALRDMDSSSPKRAWASVMNRYRELCVKHGLEPMRAPDQDNNAAISNLMFLQRQKLMMFLKLTKLMNGIPVIRIIDKQAWPTETGFRVQVKAHCRIDDPTWKARLPRISPRRYRFNLARDGKYWVSPLTPLLTVFAVNDMINSPSKWFIGFWLDIPLEPDLGGIDPERFEWFVLTQLWAPVSQKLRDSKLSRVRYI